MVAAIAEVTADEVRAAIAHAWLGGESAVTRVGRITLRAHQASALQRARVALTEYGGVLIADEVGVGKTYVALALADSAACTLIVAPAALRSMWLAALEATGVRAKIASVESLSRGRRPAGAFDLVIVDEAHHVRNPATRRYQMVAELAIGAEVVLLSATPVHNRRQDLTAVLSLFLGARAQTLGDAEIARCVIRRERGDLADATVMPVVGRPRWLWLSEDDDLLAAIVALPPALPAADAGDGGALLAHSLVRQWASSDAASRAALRRRLGRGRALVQALAAGRYPSKAELRAWLLTDDSLQLAFPELVASPASDASDFLAAASLHVAALEQLVARLGARDVRDGERATMLRELRCQHSGEKIVAFASFAETVNAMFQRLRSDGAVAALTAGGARIASGRLARDEAIARFAPLASGMRAPAECERLDLLLTTDLLSEGVNLQDASVVVHLDLPWTPARLEQRVGRVARMGATHQRVAVYYLAPPASAEALLGTERLLRTKLATAARAVGVAGAILPSLTFPDSSGAPSSESAPRAAEALRAILARWRLLGATSAREECLLVSAVRANSVGFLAAVADAERVLLLASDGGAATEAPAAVLSVASRADSGDETAVDAEQRERTIAMLARWLRARGAASDAGFGSGAAAPSRRRVIERIADITRRAPRHRRHLMADLAVGARAAALSRGGAGAERVLADLAAASMPDEAWLRAVSAFGELQSHVTPSLARATHTELLALLLLQP